MKKLSLLFLTCLAVVSTTVATGVKSKLIEVNQEWQYHLDALPSSEIETSFRTETDWIALHLSLVEQNLRQSSAKLTQRQKSNRNTALNHLKNYWKDRQFPINKQYSYRTPIFIDDYNNFCAVGYLMKVTGYENISREVSANNNLIYVKQIENQKVLNWANEFGFTVDELAWIQPGYPPTNYAKALGKGTNGEIHTFTVDSMNNKLYVGGEFSMVNGTVSSQNLAYITEDNGQYQWHSMGNVDGAVRALTMFQSELYIAGNITSINNIPTTGVGRWNGSIWQVAGCIFGTVNNFIIYKNQLYAIGDFDVCASSGEVNFARWDGSSRWIPIPGLEGEVRSAIVHNDGIYLGGDFTYQNSKENIIFWQDSNGFETFTTNLKEPVNTLCVFRDTLFAGITHKYPSQPSENAGILLYQLNGNEWEISTYSPKHVVIQQEDSIASINTLMVNNNNLEMGGHFFYPEMMTFYTNHYNTDQAHLISVDNKINKLINFNNKLIAGGAFVNTVPFGQQIVELNYICYRDVMQTSISNKNAINNFNLSPNPIQAGAMLNIGKITGINTIKLYDAIGKLIDESKVEHQYQIPLHLNGVYFIEIVNHNGEKASSKIQVY